MARLFQQSGSSLAERVLEAKAIVIEQHLISKVDEMRPAERTFTESMFAKLENDKYGDAPVITPRMLFWLRDLKDKYILGIQ